MGVTQAQKEATARYEKKAYDKIYIRLRKDEAVTAESIKAAADHAGESVNGYIKKAIAERMERENVEPLPDEIQALQEAEEDTSDLIPHDAINWQNRGLRTH